MAKKAVRKSSSTRKTAAQGKTRRPAAKVPDTRAQIAEAAYYLAEQRGFAPGSELQDWLQAERDIEARVAH